MNNKSIPWWHFWNPHSSLLGGLLMGAVLTAIGLALGIISGAVALP